MGNTSPSKRSHQWAFDQRVEVRSMPGGRKHFLFVVSHRRYSTASNCSSTMGRHATLTNLHFEGTIEQWAEAFVAEHGSRSMQQLDYCKDCTSGVVKSVLDDLRAKETA